MDKMTNRKLYVDRFRSIYVTAEPREKAEELISRLVDVLVMMDECKVAIGREGVVTEMSQGAYSIARENPASKVYDSKHKLMLSTIAALDKMLPTEATEDDEDDFDRF